MNHLKGDSCSSRRGVELVSPAPLRREQGSCGLGWPRCGGGRPETKSRPWAAGPALLPSAQRRITMSSATGLIIESGDRAQDDRDRVSVWRCKELLRAGYDLWDALLLVRAARHRPASRGLAPGPRLSAPDGASHPSLDGRSRRSSSEERPRVCRKKELRARRSLPGQSLPRATPAECRRGQEFSRPRWHNEARQRDSAAGDNRGCGFLGRPRPRISLAPVIGTQAPSP